MTFPISPAVPVYIPTGPTYSYIGQNYNPGDGFPTGAQTLTAGTKVVIVACQLAGGPSASGVTVGGVACTQACAVTPYGQNSIWYLETTLSGSQTISGTGGSGRSILHVYEMRNYSSTTPYATATNGTASSVASLATNLPTGTNTITFAAGMAGPVTVTLTASTGPALVTRINVAVESATTHYSFVQVPTALGSPTVYTATGGSSTAHGMALAAWR